MKVIGANWNKSKVSGEIKIIYKLGRANWNLSKRVPATIITQMIYFI